jgi:hypothetical protein
MGDISQIETHEKKKKKIFSFGFRCSSAAIIKRMGLKLESYPFDWLVSHRSVIRHCMETDFEEFLNIENYQRKYTNTYEMADSRHGFVCDEHLMVNVFYQPLDMLDVENTYKCRLAMNHHNITETKDKEYYTRCVERFRELVASDYEKVYLHICPVITLQMYEEKKAEIVEEIIEFDRGPRQRGDENAGSGGSVLHASALTQHRQQVKVALGPSVP